MYLKRQEFESLRRIQKGESYSSLDEEQSLTVMGLVKGSSLTPVGERFMEAFKVRNAVILAAGGPNNPFSPPKGLIEIKGVPLIERQICQLHEAGIYDITVITGYQKEMYFYLMQKYGVKIVGNPNRVNNNIYSLYLYKHLLSRTYICPCDYYYECNPFELYEYNSYHASSYFEKKADKFSVKYNSNDRIVEIGIHETQCECLNGYAFVDEEFSRRFQKLLEHDIKKFLTPKLFWEDYVGRNLDELEMYIRHFSDGIIYEFDSAEDVKSIDMLFIDNISKQITKKLCEVLKVEQTSIKDVSILDKGHSNITFKINVDGKYYVYRFPGYSGRYIVSRERESFVNHAAKELHIDDTLIYIDNDGHKISRFVLNAMPLKFSNSEQLEQLVSCVRKVHSYPYSDVQLQKYGVDVVEWADSMLERADRRRGNIKEVFAYIISDVHKLKICLDSDGFKKVIGHGNLNANNCLVGKGEFHLVDWEFAGIFDPAFDYPFHDDYLFYEEEFDVFLKLYYQREPSFEERRHWYGYRAIENYFYLCWASLKESLNEDAGNLMISYYRNLCEIIPKALKMYNL